MFGKKMKEYNPTKEELDKLQYARIKTNKATIWVKLYPEAAPVTVANFAELANAGFYDNLKFHRVIPGFMAQGGCPHSGPKGSASMAGTGGPGWAIACETGNGIKHKRGSLSMAHAGKNTGGSQFFITFVPTPHLNGVHTVFGGIEDEDVDSFMGLDSIAQNDMIEEIKVFQTRE
jgi:cyclophilin family peptidyl-prolyl cis-trans isomerase